MSQREKKAQQEEERGRLEGVQKGKRPRRRLQAAGQARLGPQSLSKLGLTQRGSAERWRPCAEARMARLRKTEGSVQTRPAGPSSCAAELGRG